jgi:hypothetical protein
MSSAYTDLSIDAGTDFETTLDLIADDGTPINITGYTFRSQIRKSYYSANVTANITVTITDATNGNTTLSIDAANTANIFPGRYVYDVNMIDASSTVSRIVEGIVTITPGVTRTGAPIYDSNI